MNFNDLLAVVLGNQTMTAIFQIAYEQAKNAMRTIAKIGSCPTDELAYDRWRQQRDEAEALIHHAKGMVASTTFLPESPFQDTITPESILERFLEEDELAKQLYK